MPEPSLLHGRSLTKSFRRGAPPAVDDVSIGIAGGESVAVIGESGSGKSTLARLLARLHRPDRGQVVLRGRDCTALAGAPLREFRREVQIVFQEPSLDPLWTIIDQVMEPMTVHDSRSRERDRRERAMLLLGEVGLAAEIARARPGQLSGGQQQRAVLARALALSPRLLIADEPLSALDPTTALRIADLLSDLRERRGMALLFISHDMGFARRLASRTVVMCGGQMVEQGPAAELLTDPLHPYTRYLLSGAVSESFDPRPRIGCAYAPRCPEALPACREQAPEMGPRVACCRRES